MDQATKITGLRNIADALLQALLEFVEERALERYEDVGAKYPIENAEYLLVEKYLGSDAEVKLGHYLPENISIQSQEIPKIVEAIREEIAVHDSDGGYIPYHPFYQNAGWVAAVKAIAEKATLGDDKLSQAVLNDIRSKVIEASTPEPRIVGDGQSLPSRYDYGLPPFYASQMRKSIYDALGHSGETYRHIIHNFSEWEVVAKEEKLTDTFKQQCSKLAVHYASIEELVAGINEVLQVYKEQIVKVENHSVPVSPNPSTVEQLKAILPVSSQGYYLSNEAILEAHWAASRADIIAQYNPFAEQAAYVAWAKKLGENISIDGEFLNQNDLRDKVIESISKTIDDFKVFNKFSEQERRDAFNESYENVGTFSKVVSAKNAYRRIVFESHGIGETDVQEDTKSLTANTSSQDAPPSKTPALIALFAGAATAIAGLFNLKKKESAEPANEGEEKPKAGFSTGGIVLTTIGVAATGWAVLKLLTQGKTQGVGK